MPSDRADLAFEIGAAITGGAKPDAIADHLIRLGWQRTPRRLHPLGAVGLILCVLGINAAVFLDWRYAVAGAAALIVCSALGAATQRERIL